MTAILFHIAIFFHHCPVSVFCHWHHHKLLCVDPGGPGIGITPA